MEKEMNTQLADPDADVKILRLNLKRQYWLDILHGDKDEEYRRVGTYWKARLVGKDFDEVHLLLGYPRKGDMTRTIVRTWKGFTVKRIADYMDQGPAIVYAIKVN